jgi:opacity protein-like surface antigen
MDLLTASIGFQSRSSDTQMNRFERHPTWVTCNTLLPLNNIHRHHQRSCNIPVTLTLVALSAFADSPALADESGWYVGTNVGQSGAKIDDPRITSGLLAAGFATTSINDDDRHIGFKVFGGYQFNRHFAVEGGYFDLGRFGFTAYTLPVGTLRGDIELKGVNLDALGILPFTQKLSAFGRVGLNFADAKDTFTATGSVNVTDPNRGKRAANYKFGVGLEYDFFDSLSMRAEAERYRINDAVDNKGDINFLSVGLVYRFGDHAAAARAAPPPPLPAPAAMSFVGLAPVLVIVPVGPAVQQYNGDGYRIRPEQSRRQTAVPGRTAQGGELPESQPLHFRNSGGTHRQSAGDPRVGAGYLSAPRSERGELPGG